MGKFSLPPTGCWWSSQIALPHSSFRFTRGSGRKGWFRTSYMIRGRKATAQVKWDRFARLFNIFLQDIQVPINNQQCGKHKLGPNQPKSVCFLPVLHELAFFSDVPSRHRSLAIKCNYMQKIPYVSVYQPEAVLQDMSVKALRFGLIAPAPTLLQHMLLTKFNRLWRIP